MLLKGKKRKSQDRKKGPATKTSVVLPEEAKDPGGQGTRLESQRIRFLQKVQGKMLASLAPLQSHLVQRVITQEENGGVGGGGRIAKKPSERGK